MKAKQTHNGEAITNKTTFRLSNGCLSCFTQSFTMKIIYSFYRILNLKEEGREVSVIYSKVISRGFFF